MLLLFSAAALQAQPAPPLPPGVTLERPVAADLLPTRCHIESFSVDWTHPLLRVRLVNGLAPGSDVPLAWASVERKRPAALRLQLVEPVEGANQSWHLALPLAGPSRPGDPASAARRAGAEALPYFAVTSLCPWLPGGPPLQQRDPELVSPLASSGALVAARWLGRVEDLDAITSLTFPARCLFSWTRLGEGRSRFALVVHESGGLVRIQDLLPWLSTVTGPGDLLAIHSQGPYATVGTSGWRLGGAADPRRAERLGGALELDALNPGELVDWARLPGAAVRASSFKTGFEPANLLRGRLWPAPFAPCVWISREAPQDAQDAPGAWVELDLNAYRPVERIVVVWPHAVGWSGQFAPRQVTLKATLNNRADWEELRTIAAPEGETLEYRFKEHATLCKLRLELGEPSGMPLDRRTRLAALQLWGAWDGQAGR